jgi:hypothetical protein
MADFRESMRAHMGCVESGMDLVSEKCMIPHGLDLHSEEMNQMILLVSSCLIVDEGT